MVARLASLGLLLLVTTALFAGESGSEAPSSSALARLPIKEVTVFKDGHAFVLHQGRMPVDGSGNVLMDYLPTAVLGTFWPYSAEKDVRLTGVVAGQQRVSVERTALELRELIEGNIGAAVSITEVASGREAEALRYDATIIGVPARSGSELEATSPPNEGEKLPQKGDIVLLQVAGGVKAVRLDRIIDVTFRKQPVATVAKEEFRNLLTLKLDWNGREHRGAEAEVGMMYVQRGLRWIPSYKVTIDGKGTALVRLEATLINELTDLDDATVNLVVGVPSFRFKDSVDPIGLQQTLARLSQHFQSGSPIASNFSNAMMSQVAVQRMSVSSAESDSSVDMGPELEGSQKSEDLFVFTAQHITLKKGQRMVVPIGDEIKLAYKDVYTLEVPFTPPPEVRREFSSRGRDAEFARLMSAAKVIHKIRLTNSSAKDAAPLTTAPALILSSAGGSERVIAQNMITYTAPGAEVDLELTTAINIGVKKSDEETDRIPNAVTWNGDAYGRVELKGQIVLTNRNDKPATIEVVRYVLGNATVADNGGKIERLNAFEDDAYLPGGLWSRPEWWGWYSWPWWWYRFNSIGRISWNVTVEPGKAVDLNYKWNYIWR